MPILKPYASIAAVIAALTLAGITLANDTTPTHQYSTLAACDLVAVPGGNVPQDGGDAAPVIFTIPAGVEVEVIPPGSIVRVGDVDWLPVAYAGEQGYLDWTCLDVYQGTPDIGEPPAATPEPDYPVAVGEDDLRLVTSLPSTGTGGSR